MKKIYSPAALLCLFFVLANEVNAQAPIINNVLPKSTAVEVNGKFEASLDLTAAYLNPYNYDEIRVEATFISPDGEQTIVEGFYLEDFEIANASGGLSPLPAGNGFRIRFSPRKTGVWSYSVSCTNAAGTGTFPAQTFICTSVISPKNNGFVQAGMGNYLNFANGDQYIPIGENIAWQATNPYVDYKNWVGKLGDNGGNFLRLWLCHWGMGLEWKNSVNGFSGLKKYKQSSSFYLDWLFDYCAERGVYVMFCLNHHGQVSSQVNPNWSESPYNAVNGGPCQNTWDFFSNAQAKSLMKNRLRYVLARWGAQRSIMTWELFNEVSWTDNYLQYKPEIAAWHAEMAAFLKQNDFAARPVSTSYGNPETEDPAVWNNPDMDFSQRHYYVDSPNLESILASGTQGNLQAYEKPALIAEFGLGADGGVLSTIDPNGIHIHNNMWGSLFGGGLGTGMSWWWDSYIEPQNLYPYFRGLAEVSGQIQLAKKDFRPTSASVSGAPGDLKLNTALGWAGLGDTLIQINSAGIITPVNYMLGQFLYGSTWNTQYRRPPVFKIEMPQAGQFKILTGNEFGTNPNLVVWLDGNQVLSVNPAANQTYTINISAGSHTLKVDNLGTDWMQISSYTFTGLGSSVDAYFLKSADHTRIAGWMLNADYNHVFVKANGAPDAISGAVLTVENMENGPYLAKWFDCQTGALLQSNPLLVTNGTITLPLPELIWDVALVVDGQALSANETVQTLPVSVFPNPVSDGPVTVSFDLPQAENTEILLLNASGLLLRSLFSEKLAAGAHSMSLQLTSNLPPGIYWLQVNAGKQRAAKAFGLVR